MSSGDFLGGGEKARWLRVTVTEWHEEHGARTHAPFTITVGDTVSIGDEDTNNGGPVKVELSFDSDGALGLRVWVERSKKIHA